MKTTPEYLEGRKIYQREMSKIKKHLPKNWVKTITYKRKWMSRKAYDKLYNNLVNMVNGRSYKIYAKRKDLVKEITELANLNKNHESKII